MPASSNKAASTPGSTQRDIQWQRFDTKDYAAAIQPTDAQVDAYYKAHAADFVAPEQAKIEYLVLDAPALQSQVKADPTLVQGFYDANKPRYTTAEERRASHILINVAPNASAADVAKAKATAESVLAEVRKNPAASPTSRRRARRTAAPRRRAATSTSCARAPSPARSATRCSR